MRTITRSAVVGTVVIGAWEVLADQLSRVPRLRKTVTALPRTWNATYRSYMADRELSGLVLRLSRATDDAERGALLAQIAIAQQRARRADAVLRRAGLLPTDR